MYITNKMHKIFVTRPYFQYTLYMFRTVSVHLQEQYYYIWYVRIRLLITQQPDVPAHTKCDLQLIKRLILKMD